MTDFKKNATVFLFFVLATLLFTYPLVLHMDSELRGNDIGALGDPMFNTWVIGRNVDRIVRLDFKDFFDGNIFYPQTKTILYSENLLPNPCSPCRSECSPAIPFWRTISSSYWDSSYRASACFA